MCGQADLYTKYPLKHMNNLHMYLQCVFVKWLIHFDAYTCITALFTLKMGHSFKKHTECDFHNIRTHAKQVRVYEILSIWGSPKLLADDRTKPSTVINVMTDKFLRCWFEIWRYLYVLLYYFSHNLLLVCAVCCYKRIKEISLNS